MSTLVSTNNYHAVVPWLQSLQAWCILDFDIF
jgi:hypothetical protein